MEHISKTMNMPKLGGRKIEVIELCEICGKSKRIREPVLGKVVPVPCDCDKERKRQEEEARRKAEAEYERQRNHKYSLMDEKARQAVFDKLTISAENKRYIDAAENYCKHWAENRRQNRGLLFYGGTGKGKTTLACCMANRLIDDGIAVKLTSVNALIQRVKDSYRNHGEDGETAIKAEIKNTPLLVLDDLGAEYKTEWSTSFLYDIIDTRYRSGKPTIITTNLSLSQLKEHLTDKNGIPRAFDRLIEVLHPVEFTGSNYRAAQAVKNKQVYNFFDIT